MTVAIRHSDPILAVRYCAATAVNLARLSTRQHTKASWREGHVDVGGAVS